MIARHLARVLGAAAALSLAATASAQVFPNSVPIIIPGIGVAAPYPSVISVSGVASPVNGVRVRLKGFVHTFPGDVAALLVAPNGQGLQLLRTSGAIDTDIDGVTLTFGVSATPLPNVYVTGNFGPSGGANAFEAPAAAVPQAGSLEELVGANVNGEWKLFVQDFGSGDFGSFSGGWEIEFGDFGLLPQRINPSAFAYQGRLDGVAGQTSADVRFSLWDNAVSTNPTNRIAGPTLVGAVPLDNGVFTAPVDFNTRLPGDRRTWLQVEVAVPSGSGNFTTLSPRQLLAVTPLAAVAAGLTSNTIAPDVATVGGRQTFSPAYDGATLTIQAAGQPAFSGLVSPGGELRLRGGNHNNNVTSPNVGVSNGGDVSLFAGQNFWNRGWNGNIRFHAGFNQPERLRIVGDTGNVGIGTTTPAATLDVRGEIKFGAAGNLSPAASEVPQRISAGTVTGTGTLANGSGFVTTRLSQGRYQIGWTAANGFATNPVVMVTVNNGAADVISAVTGTTRNADGAGIAVIEFRKTDLSFVDVGFYVMLIGPR
jgi:subtilisin-like proprotein convertase family protein